MEQSCVSGFDEKARLMDLLNSEKQLTGIYNTSLCESETVSVRNCLSSILEEEHSMQNELFMQMKSRGWYPTETAEQTKLDQAKQKFSSDCSTGSCNIG